MKKVIDKVEYIEIGLKKESIMKKLFFSLSLMVAFLLTVHPAFAQDAKPAEDATFNQAADVLPADVAPADAAPADVAPADAAPADVAPADVAPADVAPTDAQPSTTNTTTTAPQGAGSY